MNDVSAKPIAGPFLGRREARVQVDSEVITILEHVLNLRGRSRSFTLQSPLLGSVPELDSMAVVSVITAFEERFGFEVDDDEIDGSTFATVGALVAFVDGKLRGA